MSRNMSRAEETRVDSEQHASPQQTSVKESAFECLCGESDGHVASHRIASHSTGTVSHLPLDTLPLVLWRLYWAFPFSSSSASWQAGIMADRWVTHGGDLLNQRWARAERKLSPTTAASLEMRWAYDTAGDVSATPAIYKGVVYVPDWGGLLHAVNKKTGRAVWVKNFTADYGFPLNARGGYPYSRTTPAVATRADLLLLGLREPAIVFAVKRSDGTLVWSRTIETHPAAQITGSGSINSGAVYFGVASFEEVLAADPTYPCCSFIGSVVKLDVLTGELLWKTLTLPDNGGRTDLYAGAGVWGSTPAIDVARGLVYVGTGNNYRVPDSVQACQAANQNSGTSTTITDPCLEPGNNQDSVLALKLDTGAVQWARTLNPVDAYTVACVLRGPGSPNCPANPGSDFDFGMNPFLLTIRPEGHSSSQDVAIVGQKSGIVWALDRSTGEVVWSRAAGPGGSYGGIAWGMATDGRRVYAGIQNDAMANWTLSPGSAVSKRGGWTALDANTGKPLWSVENPNQNVSWGMLPTVANGVVVVGSPDPAGHVYALDAATGRTLWAYETGASVYGGASVDDGCIVVGKGYGLFSAIVGTTGGGPQKLFAACVRRGNRG